MRKSILDLPFVTVNKIHFVGIGGIGMSGIAEIMRNMGYLVQGSDVSENDNVRSLRAKGIEVFIGHKKENIEGASVVVKSTAIKDDNAEIIAAREQKIPVVARGEMLGELMRFRATIAISGAHGKTTTTSLVSVLFENAELKPTVVNGGIINSKGTNAYLGEGDYLIAEADESDGSFLKMPATIAVVTNIDREHMDYYKSFENVKLHYKQFVENIPFYGFAVLCIDDQNTRELASSVVDREVITYGINSSDADIIAYNIRKDPFSSTFDVKISDKYSNNYKVIENITIPVPGEHNVLNSLAAIAIGVRLQFSKETLVKSFSSFEGVKRRFTKLAHIDDILILDDYAHHPKEVKVTLNTARDLINARKYGRVISVFQPHRYTRMQDLFSEFVHAFENSDMTFILDIYAASEKPIEGVTSANLVNAIKQTYKDQNIHYILSYEILKEDLIKHAKAGDLILFMGAGSVTNMAKEFAVSFSELINAN